MVVVLPAPFGPRMPCTLPRLTVRSKPFKAQTSLYFFSKPLVCSATIMIIPSDGRCCALRGNQRSR